MLIVGICCAMIAQFFFHMQPCILCWIARDLWVAYATILHYAWYADYLGRAAPGCIRMLGALRVVMVLVALLHLSVIYGWSDACLSPDLMRLRGGLWTYVAAFHTRGCADEVVLWGWLSMPLLMLLSYALWEFFAIQRKKIRYKRSHYV